MSDSINIDKTAGSRSYNRLDMQVSQALHMAIEIFEDINFLLVMDYYDDISVFDDPNNPKSVSYYQMKTSDDAIALSTITSEEWLPKLYAHLNDPSYLINTLGLITNSPVKLEKQTLREKETPFFKFNDETLKKIKDDISKKMRIAVNDVDLSKFVHIRTTLTISNHKDFVEKELGDFLKNSYPRITLDSVKTIFQSIIEILTKRQACENIPEDAEFSLVRANKGVSKDDIKTIIRMTMLISIPEFSAIESMAGFREDEKMCASYEYTKILADSQNRVEGYYLLLEKIQQKMEDSPIKENENPLIYAKQIANQIPYNPIYSDMYKIVLVIALLYNNWKEKMI